MNKVVVLGLDGATFDVLDPLFEKGKLPHLASIKNNGSYGSLRSTFPPITAPAWLSMATGKNPGKTGVFYFLYRDQDNFEFKPLGSEKFAGRSFWDYLSDSGLRVGVLNYPMLYPPYDINGFMVSGIISPEDDSITFPKNLKSELDHVADGYQIRINYADPKYWDQEERLFKDIMMILEKREKALLYLINKKEWDLLFAVFSATDWAQHYYWKYLDESHCLYDAEKAAAARDHFERIWEKVDEIIGRVRNSLADNVNLLLVSDHGFGPVDQTFYVNTWLEKNGYLARRKNRSLAKRFNSAFYSTLEKAGGRVISKIPGLNGMARKIGQRLKPQPSEIIDIENSRAFALRQNMTCGMIYIRSENAVDLENTREELKARLLNLHNEFNLPFDVEVFNREELHHGEKLHLAPALFFKVNDFRCAVDPRFSRKVLAQQPPVPSRSGGHRMNGIIMGAGPDIAREKIEAADITDIAPTLLYMMGHPLPPDMDGNVLKKLFFRKFNETKTDDSADFIQASKIMDLTRDDARKVQQRLVALGYL